MSVTILQERPDSADALKLLGELDAALWLYPYPPESRHAFSVEKLLSENVAFFVARLAGVPVGCGGVKMFGSEYGEVKRMYVRPAYRVRGLGKAILNHLAEYAEAQNVGLLRLETGIHQTEAIALYERWGFERRPPFGEYREDPLSVYFEKQRAISKSAPGTFVIRKAISADSDGINQICVEAFEEFRSIVGESNWEQLRETLEHASELISDGELIVAEDSSGLLGVVLYLPHGRTNDSSLSANCALLRTLAVSPANRGRGIGRRLTQECIERARKDGADAIALTTGSMMTVALPMYERMGFIKEAELGERLGVRHARHVLRLRS
ncbi:MAG: GNAT family N-acetyltransferase [Pyrinomonadaceae bacterium]